MTISPHTKTSSRGMPSSAAVAAIHRKPGEERYALPLVWHELPLKPRAVPVRITPQPGAWRLTNQPAAFRGFGINE
jgi:hypothetical protein